METFGKFIMGLILMVLSTIIGGFILTKFWNWFVIPIFYFNQITIIQAIGLSFLISYIRFDYKKANNDNLTFEDFIKQFITAIILSGLLFLIGYIIHLFY
jgi:hypothetical protein